MLERPITLLIGATVAWRNRDRTITGTVESYRQAGDRYVLQIKLQDDSHVWITAEEHQDGPAENMWVLKHGPTTIEYGLALADLLLAGKGTHSPINHQLTTLAATAVALHDQVVAANQQIADLTADPAPAAKPARRKAAS